MSTTNSVVGIFACLAFSTSPCRVRSDHLFQGRHKAIVVDKDEYALQLVACYSGIAFAVRMGAFILDTADPALAYDDTMELANRPLPDPLYLEYIQFMQLAFFETLHDHWFYMDVDFIRLFDLKKREE